MSCKLTILDPTLKYWLKSNKFDSFKEFKTAINQALLEGFIPVGNELKIIKEGSVEVEVNGVTKTLQVKNTNSLIDIVLKGTLDSNNESDHFESFMSSFEDIYNKYKTQEIIPNSEKNTDKDFLETMLSFFEGYPVSDEFKQGETYNNFLDIKDSIRNVKEKIEDELEGDEEFDTNESQIKTGEPQEYYEYTLAAFYKPTDDEVLPLNDELSLLKHNVSKEVNRQIKEDGAEFYISFAKDNANNAQSQGWEDYMASDKFKQSGFGVVGYLYKVVAGETKRVYIKSHEKKFNGKVVLTTDPKEAITIGKNEVTGFTYTLPDFTSGRYDDVNDDVRAELVQFREDVRATGIESAPFKINGVVEEYPQAHKKNNPYERRKITALTFLQGKSPELLRLATKEEKVVYAGNLYLQMEDSKVPLDRLPLSDAWAVAVKNLLEFKLYTPAEAESVTKSLNKLLDFKGGDIRFVNWGNKIIPQRKSIITEVDGKKRFERLKEPVNISVDEAFEVLEYARINVHKEWLNEGTVAFPIIFFKNVPTGELRSTNIDVRDFYLKHHATVYRQMNVVGDTVYGPVLSPIFDVKTKGKIISEKIGAFQDNPTIGDFQVTPDGEYPLMDVLKELPSIINKMEEGKDTLSLIEALIENPEIKAKLEGVKIKFTSKNIQGTADTDLIQIGFNQLFNSTKAGEILAHEIIHVLTSDWILFNSNHDLVKELDSLIEKVPESVYDLLAKQGYGRDANGNPHPNFKLEVLARLSDPQVANALKEVGSKKSTLLEKLLDIVKKILEKVFPDLAKVAPSLYTDLLESLVKIATHRDITDTKKKKVPKVLPKNLDVIFGDAPPPISFDGFGYSAEDLYEMEEKGYSQVFLDKVKQRIDIALTNFIYSKGGLQHLLTGQVGFEEVFEYYFHSLRPRVEYLRDKGESLELDYYTFVLLNKDFVKDYWIKKTGLVRLRKPKKGEKATVEVDPDVTDVTINDTSEVTDREKEEKEQFNAEIHGGGDVIEKVADFDRSGAEFSSIESADKMAIAFVKIIPKIQRDENGTVKYDAIPEDDSKDYYIPVGSQFIRFETDEANQLVSNDYTQTWSLMAKQFTNKLSLEEMLDSLDNNPKLVESVPEIYVLKHRLSTDIKTAFQASLNAKIERSFKSAPVQIIVMLQDTNGRLNFIDESSDVTSIGKRKVDSGFLALINSEKFSKYYDRENDLVDIEALIKVGLKLSNLEDAQKVSLSSLLGFGFHPDTLKKNGVKRSEVNDFEDALYNLLTNAEGGKIPTGISEVILKGITGKDGNMIDGLNNFFKSVLEIENSIRPLNVSLMVPNAKGELQNTLFQFNSLLQYRKHYNDAQSIEELNDLIGRTKNDLFEYSLTKKQLFPTTIKDGEEVTERSKVQVKVVNLSGSKKAQKGRASEGELTINLDSSEWLKLNFVSMLDKKSGFIENTRAETASTTYAFTLSTWGKSSDYYVPVLMSEVSSDWSKDKREFNIIKDSRIYGIWESYLKGEISRIKKQNLDTPKWGLFTDILNDEEKTQMLEEINPDALIPALNRFFTAQFQEYDNLFENEMGGLDVIPDKSLVARIENNLDVVKAFVVMNTMILHNEESILFQGDISQTPQYYKRAKGVQSTGTPMSKSESLIKFINKELATNSFGSMLGFPFQIGKNFNSATIADDKKPSAFLSKFKTGFAESRRLYYNALGLKFEEEKLLEDTDTLLEDFKEVNIGDGGSVAHPDFYAAILDLAGNFSEDQRKVHQALMLDARKDAKLYFGEEFAKDINSVLTKEEEVKLKEGFDLMLEGKGQLPLVKFTHRNTMSNTDSVVVPEVMDKFAIFPLYPQFIHDKEVARELFKSMLKEQIGYVKFKSGTKIDTTPPLDIIKMIEDGQVDISFGESKHELQLEYLREQIKTPEKHKKKNTFGTQVRKNILAELGHVKLQNEKNKGDTKRKWEGLIQQFSLATEKEVLGRLGIKAIGEKWDFTSIDKVKVAEILLEEAETKDLPINIRTYFDEYRKNKINNLENAYEYFESSMGSQQIQTLLASIIKKISIQKLNGTQFRQIPVSMFSKKIMSDGKTRDLGFYVLESVISKSDKIIFGHPGIGKTFLRETRDDFIDVDNDYKEEHSTQQILRSHAKNTGKKEDLKAWEDYITTWWSKVKDDAVKSGKQIFVSNLPILRMFPQDFDKVITMSKETFVERAKQRNDYIPGEEGTEGWKNSLDVAIDKIDKSKVITTDKYLSDLLKSRVVPAECKIGMGGDFVNLLNLQDVEDYLSQNKLEDTTMNRLRALNKKLEDESWVEAHKDVLTIASYRIPNQGHNSDEVMVIREFLPPMHAGEIVLPPEVTTQSGTDYDYDKMSAIVPSIGKDGKLITEGVKGIQNEMIKTFADILLDPVNYHKLIVPNSNAIVFNLLKKDLLPKLYKGYDPNAKLRPTEIVTIKRNLRQFKAVKGKDLLGIAAVWNPFTTILQNHDIEIQNFYTKKIGFGDKAKSIKVDVVPKLGNKKVSLFTMDGTNKLEIISQLVNVTVDMPSDDTFGMSALNTDDFGAFIYSISALSYNFKDAMYLFHQPIVLDFKIKVSNKVKSGTKRYKAVTEVLYELFGIPIEKKEDAIDYTKSENQLYSKILGEYEENLNPELENPKPIGEKYEITEQQKAVLAHYIKLLDQASHLRVAQQALNFDTSPDNNLAKARQRKENYKDAVASGIIHKDKINEVMLNSVISGLYVSDIFESLITEMFPVLYSKENKTMFTQLAGNYKQNQEIAFRKAASDFLLAIVQNYGKVNNVNITDVVSPFIEGKYKTLLMKGASDTIEKLKKEGKNYRLLNILTVSIAKDGNKANPQLTLGLENNSDDKNILTEEFRDLLKSEDPKIKSFAEHLAIIGFIQSGWSKSPLYFSDLIPKEFITPIINDAIKSYEGLDETEKKGFLSAFFFNFDYYEGISLGRSKRERHTDSYRLMDWRRGVAEKIADFKKEDTEENLKESKDEYLDYVETLNKNKTSDTYQYFGATYNIILENGKGIDVEGYQGKNKNKQKLLEAYNTNPNVDPQSGKAFRTTPVEKPTQSAQKNFYEFSDGFKVETDFALNEEQKEALKDLEDFVKGKSKTIALSGAAGTGKTTVVSIFDKWLKNKKYIYPKYSAPTHRANAVTKLMNPSADVFTLHSLFGLTPDIEFEESNFDVKELEFAQKNKLKIEKGDVLIIDESSMISDSLFDFLESAQTIHNVRIIYVGDYAQLKPVKQKEKSKVFTGSHKVSNLVKVERTGENAILAESVNIREGKDWSYQTSLNSKREGVEYISTREQMFEIADKLFLEQSISENKMKFRILSATNKAVTEVNQMIRKVLYKENGEKQLVKGELLMGYDNFDYNYKTGQFKLYNGGDYEVKEINPATKTVESIGETFTGFSVLLQNVFDSKELPISIFVADINEDDSKAIKLADEIQKLQKAGQKAMSVGMGQEAAFYFAEANALKSKVAFMKDITKFDSADRKPKVVIRKTFDYGYAHTIHKAQGGTYENVMILADTLAPFDKNSQQELKYVAVSRAKKIAYIRTNHELKQPLVQDNTQEQLVFTKGTKGIGKEISSYQYGLEYALTNPVFTSPTGTEWKRDWTEGQSKWREYMSKGIEFEGFIYKDVEHAYQQNKSRFPIGKERDDFMQSLLEIKLRTYPKLIEGIDAKGGLRYLTDSTHQPTKKNSHWETGGNNAFIELLTKAYLSIKGTQEQSYGYSQEDIDSLERDNAVKQVFNENPELEAIGTVQQYSQYLNTIFPDYIDNFAYEAVEELLVANKIIDRKC
jgi:DNA replication protein DnaC